MPHPPPSSAPADPRRRWGGHHCGYSANAFMLRVALRALWLAHFLAYFVALWFFLAVPRARRASLDYLDRLAASSSASSPRSRLRRLLATYLHMVEFGKLLLDRAVMLASHGHGFTVTPDGADHLRSVADDPRGLLLLTAHLGITEAAVPYLSAVGLHRPLNLVMYLDRSDPTEQFHARHRALLENVHLISTTDPLDAGLKILAALNRGQIVALRADRALSGRSVPVALLHSPAEFPAGPFAAAALTGVPVISVFAVRTGYRRYRCIISAPRTYTGAPRDQLVARAAADFAADLDSILRQYPRQWNNFYPFWPMTARQ